MDDFDLLTDNGRLLTEDGEFGQLQFRDMMRGELWRYSRRELVNVLAFSGEAPVVLRLGRVRHPYYWMQARACETPQLLCGV